ncbi:MAG: helix-turn-helix transcriptional regulator [Opitutaceae bacterium]|nr:helix-turn-helix transcriptional regulator [Opitutaceae bacterium]
MTDAHPEGGFALLEPNPSLLPPAANGYRRSLNPGRGVSVYCDRHPPNEWGEHWHVQDQVVGLLDDVECTIRVKDAYGEWAEAHVSGPTVWVIPAGRPHALICPKEADMITLYAERAFVRETIEQDILEFEMMPLSQLTSRDEVIGQLSKAFRRICGGREKTSQLYIEAMGTVLGAHILQAIYASGARADLAGGLPDWALRRVSRHIDEHLADSLRLGTLAKAAGYQSTSYFGRLFKRSFSLTPHNYVMRRRVAKAQELLETTSIRTLEIAQECGFSDDTMMGRWFRRVSDRLPSDIRP